MDTVALIVLLTATLGGGPGARLPVADSCPLKPGLTARAHAAVEAVMQAAS